MLRETHLTNTILNSRPLKGAQKYKKMERIQKNRKSTDLMWFLD